MDLIASFLTIALSKLLAVLSHRNQIASMEYIFVVMRMCYISEIVIEYIFICLNCLKDKEAGNMLKEIHTRDVFSIIYDSF